MVNSFSNSEKDKPSIQTSRSSHYISQISQASNSFGKGTMIRAHNRSDDKTPHSVCTPKKAPRPVDGDEDVLSPGTLDFLDEAREPSPSVTRSPATLSSTQSSTFGDDSSETNSGSQETEAERQERSRREEEESIALARALMAEEAMAVSYHISVDYLNNNRDQFSEEDLAALQAAIEEDEEETVSEEEHGGGMSYEMMLRLGETLGDVKSERWARVAQEKIDPLPTLKFNPEDALGKDANDCEVKCLVCQYSYEKGESLRRLPCKHCFHSECVDQWLLSKDCCPYCRKAIVEENNQD